MSIRLEVKAVFVGLGQSSGIANSGDPTCDCCFQVSALARKSVKSGSQLNGLGYSSLSYGEPFVRLV